MKKITILLFIFTLLIGCQDKQERTTVCKGINGDILITNTIKYVGKKVTTVSYEETLAVDESLISYISNYLDSHKETLQSLNGVTFTYKIDGSNVITTTTIDYEIASIDELVNAGLMESEQSDKEKVIDYEMTLNYMKALGLTCTEE